MAFVPVLERRMKSAIAIAIDLPGYGRSEDFDECAEAIQQAREDGARWALEQARARERENARTFWEAPDDILDINPADVRKVAP